MALRKHDFNEPISATITGEKLREWGYAKLDKADERDLFLNKLVLNKNNFCKFIKSLGIDLKTIEIEDDPINKHWGKEYCSYRELIAWNDISVEEDIEPAIDFLVEYADSKYCSPLELKFIFNTLTEEQVYYRKCNVTAYELTDYIFRYKELERVERNELSNKLVNEIIKTNELLLEEGCRYFKPLNKSMLDYLEIMDKYFVEYEHMTDYFIHENDIIYSKIDREYNGDIYEIDDWGNAVFILNYMRSPSCTIQEIHEICEILFNIDIELEYLERLHAESMKKA